MTDRSDADAGREVALSRLRHELSEHDRAGSTDTPFYAGIRETLAQEDARDERGSGSAA